MSGPPPLVRVAPGVIDRLLERHAGALCANEPCALLLGRRDAAGLSVLEVRPAQNVHPLPEEAFLAAPDDAVRAEREARERGLCVVGAWHGHPRGPARLSRADAEGLSLAALAPGRDGVPREPPFVYLVSGAGAGRAVVVRAFAADRRGPREVSLRADLSAGSETPAP